MRRKYQSVLGESAIKSNPLRQEWHSTAMPLLHSTAMPLLGSSMQIPAGWASSEQPAPQPPGVTFYKNGTPVTGWPGWLSSEPHGPEIGLLAALGYDQLLPIPAVDPILVALVARWAAEAVRDR